MSWVRWSGFVDDPQHELAERLLGGRYPSIVTFGAAGGYEASIEMFNRVELFKRLVNLGDAKSLVSHPASTTHRQLNDEELRRAGISPDMIRLSIGIEHIDDIIDDLDRSLGRENLSGCVAQRLRLARTRSGMSQVCCEEA